MRIKPLCPVLVLFFLFLYSGHPSICARPDASDEGFVPDEAEEIRRAYFHYRRGQKLYREGRIGRAIEELYTAAGLREDYPEAQMLLARALVASERPREAVAALRGLTMPHRGSPQALKLFGWAYCLMNRLNEAEESLQKAFSLTLRPDAESHYLMGLVKLRRQDHAGAVAEAKLALALNPRYANAHRLLSDAYLLWGKPRLAERSLRRQLKLARKSSEVKEINQRLAPVRSLAGARHGPSSYVAPQIHHVPQPKYTEQARRNRVEGVVRLQVLFGRDGRVHQCLVTQGLGFGLDEESERAARQIEFTPAQLNKHSFSSWGGVVFRYSLLERQPLPDLKRDKRDSVAPQIARR